MHIITDTETARLIAVGTFKEYWDNGYPIITDKDGNDCAYPSDFTTMHEVSSLPEGVIPDAYCYTSEEGFYKNPDYVEPNPYGLPDEILSQIKDDAIAEVEEAVLNGTDK